LWRKTLFYGIIKEIPDRKKHKEALNKPKCADWRADFSPDEGEKSQMYFVYIKISRQNQTEKMPSRRARRLIQRFHRKS